VQRGARLRRGEIRQLRRWCDAARPKVKRVDTQRCAGFGS
jgi:hypothetical protein